MSNSRDHVERDSSVSVTPRAGRAVAATRPDAVVQRRLRDRIGASTRVQAERATPWIGRLPARLGAGIETLSGLSMDHVRVHHDSPEPARLRAHAYTRGGDIHLAPGQGHHLAHEAWHVVQQARGTVRANASVAGVALNDDAALEREADVMGTRALQGPTSATPAASEARATRSQPAAPVVQRVTAVGANVQTNHVLLGAAQMSDEQPVDAANQGEQPVLIEVMEGNANVATARDAAIAKIDAIAASASNGDNRGIMIALNTQAPNGDVQNNRLRANRDFAHHANLVAAALAVAQHAEGVNVQAGCYPAIWAPTAGGAGYTFPFLEMRAQVTLHPGTAWMLGRMRDAGVGDPIMRSMDADVINDPLLANPLSGLPLGAQRLLGDIGRAAWEERQVGGADVVPDLSKPGAHVVSGGYNWDTSAKAAAFWDAGGAVNGGFAANGAVWNRKLTACLDLINDAEHDIRERYAALVPATVYWPEPNNYMESHTRVGAAQAVLAAGQAAADVQQRESTHYLRDINNLVGHYDRSLATTKPLKNYFDDLRDLIRANRVVTRQEAKTWVESVRQTHLSPGHLQHILQWHAADALDESQQAALEAIRATISSRVTAAVVVALR